MPELPEVETVRSFLEEKIVNKKIENIEVIFSKLLKNVSQKEFERLLKEQKIISLDRRGKYLILNLDDFDLLIHLRMEGKLFYYDKRPEIKKHDHITFKFTDDTYLIYNDVRKFGTFDLFKKGEYLNCKKIFKLGKEPKDLTSDYLFNKLKKSKKSIKASLLDQEIISGLGNIYVDEVLFAAKIHPKRVSKSLFEKEVERIVINTKRIIKEAIQKRGTTIKSFSFADQIKGEYQQELKVYKRNGQKCFVCTTTIEKIVVVGRGTHFCPKCQREYENSN